MDYKVVANPLSGLMSILSIVGMWKILEDRGEAGWKSLIPFYSTWTFAKTFNDTETAKKVILSTFALLLSSLLLLFAIAAQSGVLTIVATAVFVLAIIFTLVYYVKLYRHFDIANNGPSWMIVVWLIVPSLAALFYAFIQNNYNIPGVTEIHQQQETETNSQQEEEQN